MALFLYTKICHLYTNKYLKNNAVSFIITVLLHTLGEQRESNYSCIAAPALSTCLIHHDISLASSVCTSESSSAATHDPTWIR